MTIMEILYVRKRGDNIWHRHVGTDELSGKPRALHLCGAATFYDQSIEDDFDTILDRRPRSNFCGKCRNKENQAKRNNHE